MNRFKNRMGSLIAVWIVFIFLLSPHLQGQAIKQISKSELKDKIHAYWVGQLVGNYIGFPFENLYQEQPIPILIDRYYNAFDLDSLDLKMNTSDRRAYIHIIADALGGAWTDDDTDIEFVSLHAVEEHGLDLTYPEITEFWKKHINRYIWSANRNARDLMESGMIPPATGSKINNDRWYCITSQLVNEIWSVFYPGMIQPAVKRAGWGARIMCDGFSVHATQAYAAMYSAAFFESDVNKLVQIAIDNLPAESPYRKGMEQVVKWHSENADWRDTRKMIYENYYYYVNDFRVPLPFAGSVVNGLSGIMALLYGEGDFLKTTAIATSAGFDCDNQAATCAGLIGVIHGMDGIPLNLTTELPSRNQWSVPFNDQYINYSRDDLPNYNTISDIVERILQVSEDAILEQGGSKELVKDETIYTIVIDGN